MRLVKIVLGLLCIGAAFLPGSLAVGLFTHVIAPSLNTAPNTHIHNTVFVLGFQLQGWMLYMVPLIAGLAATGLVIAGMFLLLCKSDDNA